MSRVDRFVKKKDVDLRDTPFGNDSQPSNHHALTAQQRRAKDLRMKVPVTRLEAKPESNVSSLSALAKALAARYPLRSDSESGSQKSKFDDTELEDSTIGSIDGIAHGQSHVVTSDYNRFSPDAPQHYEQQYGEGDNDDRGPAHLKMEEDDRHHQDDVHFHDPSQLQVGPAFWDEVGQARRDPDNARYLQAQALPIPNFIQNPVAVRSSSPVPFRERPTSRPRPAQKSIMAPPAKPTKSTAVIVPPTTTIHTTTFDKTSSYTDSSANTTPPPPNDSRETNKRKRSISDLLDHDPATLKSMSFSDLDNQPFDLDPRRPADTSSASTSTASHLKKLQTLKSFSDSERAKFFASQTKDQWIASTEFFQNRFGELFKELRTARDGRREVAMRFESEVRERMGIVRTDGEGIERCLGEIRGKARGVLPPRSGTPMR